MRHWSYFEKQTKVSPSGSKVWISWLQLSVECGGGSGARGAALARRFKVKRLTVLSNSLNLIKSINGELEGEACIASFLWDINVLKFF